MQEEMPDLVNGRSETPKVPSPLGDARTAVDWLVRRREVLALFEREMFGKLPPLPERIAFETDWEKPVYDGLGLCRQVTIRLGAGSREMDLKALWLLPAQGDSIPLICALNFCGNAGTLDDPDIARPASELSGPAERRVRGWQSSRWDYSTLLAHGVSVLTAPRNQFFPDISCGRFGSVFRLFHPEGELTPEHREFTAISAWAWGYSRLVDLALTEPRVNPQAIWVHGHSRLGKTALWCGANDPRVAGVVSNDSGCCGASLEREHHPDAENFERIARTFDHRWFVPAFNQWIGKAEQMPFDLNWLAALIAPRPLLICSASLDVWADPFNEFRCAKSLSEVYRLFGAQGLPDDAHFPAPDEAILGDRVGYSLRQGKHDVTTRDWIVTLQFMKANLTGENTP